LSSKADLPSTSSLDQSVYEGVATALVLDSLDAQGLRRQAIQCGICPRTTDRVIVGRAKTLLWMDFAHDEAGLGCGCAARRNDRAHDKVQRRPAPATNI